MFQSYLQQIRKNTKLEEKTEHSPWDDYIDRQLEHLVVEYYFDFQQITRQLIGLASEGGQKKITKKRVQERWKFLHLKRIKDREKTEEEKRMDKIAKSILKMEDPRRNLKVNDIIKTLPQSRQNKDFLKVSEDEIKNAKFIDSNGQKCTPTTFNVLKDSIKGIKDEKEREKQNRKVEMDFLQNLEKLQTDEPDQQMQEKPLMAKFVNTTNFIVEREIMTQEHVQRLLAQKVNLNSETSAPEPEFCPQMDNFVSRFAKPEEQNKKQEIEEVKKEETDTQTEQEDQSGMKKQQQQQQIGDQGDKGDDLEDIQIEKKLLQFEEVQTGNITIEDAISQYEDMRQNTKKLEIFDLGKNQQSQKPQYLQQFQNSDNLIKNNENIEQKKVEQQQELFVQEKKQNQQQLVIEELYNDDEMITKNQNQQQQQNDNNTQIQNNQQQQQQQQQNINQVKIENTQQPTENKFAVNQFSQLIHQELTSFQQKKAQKIDQNQESSSEEDEEESDDEELDFLELCRLNLKADDPQSSQIQERIAKMREDKKNSKELKKNKKKKKVAFGETNVNNDNDQVFSQLKFASQNAKGKGQIEAALNNENNQNNKEKEWNDLSNEQKFSASIEFQKQQQLEEELQRKKEQEKKKDLEEIQQIESRFADLQEERERKKKEERQKKLDEQVKIQSEKQKEEERLRKEEEQKVYEQQMQYLQQQEREKAEQTIKQKINEIESQIKNYKLRDTPVLQLFDDNISYLQNISGLPQQIKKKIQNYKNYENSRDGITNRYQILIFPYIDNLDFLCQFLQFFLRNSFFKHPPTEEELNEFNPQLSEKINLSSYPRLSSHGFPFCLVSFSIGSYSPNIKDEPDVYMSEYLNPGNQKLQQDLSENKLIKCIYLYFDTNLGRGSQILMKQLDITLSNIVDKKVIDKVTKDLNSNYNCNTVNGLYQQNLKLSADMKLSDFMIDHQKSQELASKLFCEAQTFHGFCPCDTLQSDKQLDHSIIIIRNFAEIKFLNENNDQTGDNTAISNSECISTLENQSITAQSEQRFIPANSVLQHLIRRLDQCGLQMIGMRSVYFNEENSNEFSNNIEKIKFEINISKPVICLAISGYTNNEKLKKIVGAEDPILAKKLDSKSLNALFAQTKDDCILTPYNKIISKKMLSFFFGGRIQKINNLNQIDIIEGKIPKKVLYLFKPKQNNPIFYLNYEPFQEYIILISYQINPSLYGKMFEILKKRGIQIQEALLISDKHIEYLLKQVKDKEQLDNLLLNSLHSFNFCPSQANFKRHALNLILKVSGNNIKSLRNKILNKVFHYNSLVHPSKKDLIFFSCNQEIKILFENNILQSNISLQLTNQLSQEHGQQQQLTQINPSFTEYAKFSHFIVIWPFINNHHKENGVDLQVFTDNNLELICFKKINASQIQNNMEQISINISYMLFNNNINQNKQLKKHQEFTNYCKKIPQILLTEDFIVAAFRQQEELDTSKKEKFIDHLFNQPTFANSNQKASENLIFKIGARNFDYKDFPYEFFEIFFFEVPINYLKEVNKNLSIQLYDDISFKNSFIFDVPPQGNNILINTVILLSQDVMQLLSLNGVIKRLEAEQFQIQVCVQCKITSEMSDTIIDNLNKQFKILDSTQDQQGQVQKLSYKIEMLQEMFEKQSFWCLLVKRENAIFLGKKILKEFTEKYAIFKKEDFSWKNLEQLAEYQITYGLYTTNNLLDLDQEVICFKTMLNQLNSVYQSENLNIEVKDNEHIFILMRFDEIIEKQGIYEFLSKMQELKIRIDNFSINQSLSKDSINYISSLFAPKFESKAIVAHIQNINLEEVSFAFILANIKQSIQISNAFGTIRLNEKGEFLQLIKGQLKFNNFLIYTENPENIVKLKKFAFQ